MFTDPKNPRDSKILDRRDFLKQRIVTIMKNPELIIEQRDVLFVERYGNYLALFFHCPVANRKYETVPLDGNFVNYRKVPEESKQLLFCYERNWENEGYDKSVPVIEMKDGRQIECAMLNLDDFEVPERALLVEGFTQVRRIIEQENATIKE